MPFDPSDPDTIAALEKAVTTATSGLVNKNNELLGEVKKLKNERGETEELKSKLAEIEDEKARKAGDFEKLEKSMTEKHLAETSKLTEQLNSKTTALEKLLIDNGLSTALESVNVTNPAFKEAATALLRDKVKLVDDKAMVDSKPLADFVKEWAGTDKGSAFVSAPENKGSGASGGTNNATGKTFSELTDVEKVALKNSDRNKYNELVAESKRSM